MAAASEVEFDYDLSKANYMAQVRKYFDEDSTHSAITINKTIEVLKGPVKTHLHKYYELLSLSSGLDKLTEKRKTPEDPEVQVLSFEDVFDIFMKFHVANNHTGGRQYLMSVEKQLKTVYNYPSVCLSLLVKSCNVCLATLPKPATTRTKIASVYTTVMIQKGKDNPLRYILIYFDKTTDFVVIRPLKQKSDIEIAMEISKILMQFGPPQKLYMHGYNTEFNKKVGIYLRQVCPMFTFSIEYRSANFDPSAYVVDKLQKWMRRNCSLSWEIGCMVVQKELNMDIKLIPRYSKKTEARSPFELFYGRTPANAVKKNYAMCKPGHVFEIRYNSDDDVARNINTDPETNIYNDDIVELRIPNAGNYNLDLLSQLEDSEASEEKDAIEIQSTIKTESEEITIEENEIIEKVLPIKIVGLHNENEIEEPPTLVTLDLEVDDDTIAEPDDEDDDEDVEEMNTRRSLRIIEKKAKITEWIEEIEEEMVFRPDDVRDPLDMDVDGVPK